MPEQPPLKFPYRVVEKGLAVAFRIPEERRQGGFRSLIGNLQKLGALGAQARVGRGVALNYTPLEIHRLLLTLEICEFGIPPATAVALVETYWDLQFWPIIAVALDQFFRDKPAGDDVILYLRGVSLRTGSLRGEAPGAPNIGRCSLDALPIELRQWMTATPDDPAPPRALVVNLSARLRAFHSALGVANLDDALDECRAALVGEQPPAKAPVPAPSRRARNRRNLTGPESTEGLPGAHGR